MGWGGKGGRVAETERFLTRLRHCGLTQLQTNTPFTICAGRAGVSFMGQATSTSSLCHAASPITPGPNTESPAPGAAPPAAASPCWVPTVPLSAPPTMKYLGAGEQGVVVGCRTWWLTAAAAGGWG